MRKKLLLTALVLAMLAALLAGCAPKADGLKVGFITDGSPLKDGGINQTIVDTLESLKEGVQLEVVYSEPKDTLKASLLDEIKKLINGGCNMLILHSYTFAEILQEAQILYPSCRFVALDFAPATMGDSVVSVQFSAHEAGFMAGFAAAIRLEQGRFGAVLGLEIPAWQQYSYGFQQGVLHANETEGTRVTMSSADFRYIGTVTNESLAQQMAAQLYDSGVDCLFVAAGKAGAGAIIEAKLRRANGEDIWAVGSEYSQFHLGTYDGNNSVIITSAIKRWNDAVIDTIDKAMRDKFPGRETLIYSAANGGVGIPTGEYNLTVDMRLLCTEVAEELKKGDIKVSDVWFEGLIR